MGNAGCTSRQQTQHAHSVDATTSAVCGTTGHSRSTRQQHNATRQQHDASSTLPRLDCPAQTVRDSTAALGHNAVAVSDHVRRNAHKR
jgi:hypothetical protein